MWMLHAATYFYVMLMDRTVLSFKPNLDVSQANLSRFSGSYGTLSPGLQVNDTSFGSLVDVLESHQAWKNVNIASLDLVAGFLPFAFLCSSFLTGDLIIWTKVMLCNACLAFLKGVIGLVTTIPDSSGWQNCQTRLGPDHLQYLREGLPNPFQHGLFSLFLSLIRMEIDGPMHNRVLSGMRWCADMMYSGHTYFTCLYALGILELLQKQAALKLVGRGTYWILTAIVLVEQMFEVRLVLENRFHYFMDVFVAIVMTLFCYTNGPIVIASNWWARNFHTAALVKDNGEGKIWVPPFCVPFCLFSRMDGYHTLTWTDEETAVQDEILHQLFGIVVSVHARGARVSARGVIIGVDVGSVSKTRARMSAYVGKAAATSSAKYYNVCYKVSQDGKNYAACEWFPAAEIADWGGLCDKEAAVFCREISDLLWKKCKPGGSLECLSDRNMYAKRLLQVADRWEGGDVHLHIASRSGTTNSGTLTYGSPSLPTHIPTDTDEQTHRLVFEPGPIGMVVYQDGVVKEVEKGGQGERLGVRAGWLFHMLEEAPYSLERLDALIAGGREYDVTFKAPKRHVDDVLPLSSVTLLGQLDTPSPNKGRSRTPPQAATPPESNACGAQVGRRQRLSELKWLYRLRSLTRRRYHGDFRHRRRRSFRQRRPRRDSRCASHRRHQHHREDGFHCMRLRRQTPMTEYYISESRGQ
jgi:hypothetical protein